MQADDEHIMRGEPLTGESANKVDDVPQQFKQWTIDNEKRLATAKSMPYFVRDNEKYFPEMRITDAAAKGVKEAQGFNEKLNELSSPRMGSVGAVTGTKLGRTATKAALKIYEDVPAPILTKEVQANTAKIACIIGLKSPRPMTFLEADKGAGNISLGKSFEYSQNCQIAVAVHEARLRGLNVTSLGYDHSTASVSFMLGEHFEDIWQHPKTYKTPKPSILRDSSFDTILDKLDTLTKSVGRYHIGINMRDNGHVITAERLASGEIIFYDAQIGDFLKLEEYSDRNVEYLEVLKVDKLLLRGDLFKVICRLL